MAVQYAHAGKGKEFRPTSCGVVIGRIANKYKNIGALGNKQYLTCVPKSWITNGWVREVENAENTAHI